MYEYIIMDEHGSIVYADTDKHHTKAVADVMQQRTGRPYFVDCMLATLCDHTPINTIQNVPDQPINPPEYHHA